jgi:hypothetical protein
MSFFQFPAREYKKKFKLLIPLPLIAQFTISPCSPFQTTAQIRNQLGQGPDPAPLQDREILQLEKKPSWIADASDLPPVESFVRDFANVQGPDGGASGVAGNYTTFLWQAIPQSQPTAQQPQFIAPDPCKSGWYRRW